MDNTRRNTEIKSATVRLISFDGKPLGVMQLSAALRIAQQQNLDLIEVNSKAEPPVCKLGDWNKVLFESKKKDKDEKRKQREQSRVKEIQLHPNIHSSDLQTKTRFIRDFLSNQIRVRIIMSYRGREVSHRELGEQIINQIIESTKDVGILDSMKNDVKSILAFMRPIRNEVL